MSVCAVCLCAVWRYWKIYDFHSIVSDEYVWCVAMTRVRHSHLDYINIDHAMPRYTVVNRCCLCDASKELELFDFFISNLFSFFIWNALHWIEKNQKKEKRLLEKLDVC